MGYVREVEEDFIVENSTVSLVKNSAWIQADWMNEIKILDYLVNTIYVISINLK